MITNYHDFFVGICLGAVVGIFLMIGAAVHDLKRLRGRMEKNAARNSQQLKFPNQGGTRHT